MVVRGGLAIATWPDGETPVRAAHCEEALPCAASKRSGRGEMVGAQQSNVCGEGAMQCELGGRQGDNGELSAAATAV